MKIYQVLRNLNSDIIEIECSRITESFYWTSSGRRNALRGNYHESFDDKEQAIKYMESLFRSNIASAKRTFEYYEQKLSEFKSKYPR